MTCRIVFLLAFLRMSYAKLAGLAPEFGLYSSFAGVVIYAFCGFTFPPYL